MNRAKADSSSSRVRAPKQRSKEDDFTRLQKLGQGSFGVVYMVKRKQDGKMYVLKVIETKQMSSQ